MKPVALFQLWFVIALLALTGCSIDIDAPQTPTVAASPTIDRTAIARLATRTPTVSYTPTNTTTATPSQTPTATSTQLPTYTPSHTATETPSDTPTDTVTATSTLTRTPTLTMTTTPTQTATSTATNTATPPPTYTSTYTVTATNTVTPERSSTPSSTTTATLSPTPLWIPSPTQAIAQLAIPTATSRATMTFTPFPTITPDYTGTWAVEHADPAVPPPTPTPGGIYTLTPAHTREPTIISTQNSGLQAEEGSGTFYDPNASGAEQDTLPNAPVGSTGPSGPSIPEQSMVVVSYAGQIVPLLDLPAGAGGTGTSLAEGDVFATSSTGQVAAVSSDRWLRINGQPVTVSPSSEFGLNDNLSIHDLAWSPDGQHLAIQIDAANPSHETAISSGVWIYEPASHQSWQVFRNTFPGQTEQLHHQRQAIGIQWSPNGLNLLITVNTPLGRATVFMPTNHNANEFINALEFSDATWALDSQALIVSGHTWNGATAVGWVTLDQNWTYTEYANQQSTGLIMQAAAQLRTGAIAFLGQRMSDSFALYTIQPIPGAQPQQISATLMGQIVSAEWNPERTAVLVTIQANTGYRLWIIRIDGTAQSPIPEGSVIDAAHWR